MEILISPQMSLWIWRIVPVGLGAAGGFAYQKFIGCKSGGCPITSNRWISTMYGALLGSMFVR